MSIGTNQLVFLQNPIKLVIFDVLETRITFMATKTPQDMIARNI
jgi:hypothetical protein